MLECKKEIEKLQQMVITDTDKHPEIQLEAQ